MTKFAYEKIKGLIDFGILGSGDSHMAFALINKVENSFSFPHDKFNSNYLKLLEDWQANALWFNENKKIGFADWSSKFFPFFSRFL